MIMLQFVRAAIIAVPLAVAMTPMALPALAASQGLVAVVNDIPITEQDVSQRIALMKILGDGGEGMSRKRALQSLIDEQVKLNEAEKYRMTPSDGEVRDQIARIAKGMNTTPEDLTARLKKQGISRKTFERYVTAMIGFNRIISSKNREEFTVTDADVDAKFNEIKSKADAQLSKIMNDPRMKPVTVYELMEITLPLDGTDEGLLQARAADAAQVASRLKGCRNAKAAASGVFNVKIGKKVEADASKLPKPMKAALDQAGVGRAIGPIRGQGSIQLIAFCGSRKITPPKPDFKMPTRDQVRRMLVNQKYDGAEEDYLKTVRGNVYVEYRDPDYAQQ
jgi:peptidyl-prolyl cis-trans isomerase SurA